MADQQPPEGLAAQCDLLVQQFTAFGADRKEVKAALTACAATIRDLRAQVERLQAGGGVVACNSDECGWTGPTSDTRMLGSIGPLCPRCGETTEAAHPPAAPTPLPEHADHVPEIAARLRLVASLAGCPSAVPENDATAVGAIFSVLGNMRFALERKAAAPALVPLTDQEGWLIEALPKLGLGSGMRSRTSQDKTKRQDFTR